MAIAATNFLLGIATTARIFDAALTWLALASSHLEEFSSASIDSEFRFYSVFWFAYGVMLWRTARDLGARLGVAGILIGLFALGGVGRLLSYSAFGVPANLFLVLTWIEIMLTIVMAVFWFGLVRRESEELQAQE